MNVWAFNKVEDDDVRQKVYQSIQDGKSRFGWSSKDDHNLKLENNWTSEHSRQRFLLRVKKGDWIIHINTPVWGKCVAAKVIEEYDFDDGLEVSWGAGRDFRHHFQIDVETIVEFDRKDQNISPTVNLNPRQRAHRVKAVDDFSTSLQNLKENRVILAEGESKGEYYLKGKTEAYLKEMTSLIHEMNKSKNLERFLAKVFNKIPDVVDVKENGQGWGTDYGADLLVTTQTSVGPLSIEKVIVVQVKSFEGKHYEVSAVEQVQAGIKKFNADAGMIITTAERTEELENAIQEITDENDYPIELIAGDDVARFVIKYAPDLLFKM